MEAQDRHPPEEEDHPEEGHEARPGDGETLGAGPVPTGPDRHLLGLCFGCCVHRSLLLFWGNIDSLRFAANALRSNAAAMRLVVRLAAASTRPRQLPSAFRSL